MNIKDRIEAVRAMELLARSCNDEEVMELWLMYGVADGDITENTPDEELEHYVTDNTEFSELMDYFLYTMREALESGGLYVDGVCSGD